MDLTWAQEELAGIELGDARLEKRAAVLLDELGKKPSASIPMACGGWGETLAAYRFLGNEKCHWADILVPHMACTQTRMANHGRLKNTTQNMSATASATCPCFSGRRKGSGMWWWPAKGQRWAGRFKYATWPMKMPG
jgi:hypothetical protein